MKSKSRKISPCGRERRGNVLVMMAIMMVAVFACTALCIDIGWTTVTKSELQNAADSAAIAGAGQLQNFYGSYSLAPPANQSGVLTMAKESAGTQSIRYAGFNAAGGVSNLSLPGNDIIYGFTDAGGNFTANVTGFPNTVQVMTRRDGSANSSLPLFFAPAIGTKSVNLTATASATVYTGLISSFNPHGGGEDFGGSGSGGGGFGGWGDDYGNAGNGFRCTLLPLAFDVNSWNQFVLHGKSPDGNVYPDSSGVPQIQVYPSPHNSPGNFGLLCIGPWTNADPSFVNWILNGPSAGDLQALIDAGSFPVSTSKPKPWKGSPGLRSNLVTDLQAIISEPRLLPLFQPVSLPLFQPVSLPLVQPASTDSYYQAANGSGSNTTYNIVGFAGVNVSQVIGQGGTMQIFVQPCDVTDPCAVFDSATVYPAGAEPAGQMKTFTHPAPKFTN